MASGRLNEWLILIRVWFTTHASFLALVWLATLVRFVATPGWPTAAVLLGLTAAWEHRRHCSTRINPMDLKQLTEKVARLGNKLGVGQ